MSPTRQQGRRSAKAIIDQAIRDTRPWEYLLYSCCVVFVLMGLGLILAAVSSQKGLARNSWVDCTVVLIATEVDGVMASYRKPPATESGAKESLPCL
jgi:hypothetical protein